MLMAWRSDLASFPLFFSLPSVYQAIDRPPPTDPITTLIHRFSRPFVIIFPGRRAKMEGI